jgi:hypothetical protein
MAANVKAAIWRKRWMMSRMIAPAKTLNKRALFRDLGYEPHEGQRLIHESTASRRVVACGTRWGKSVCAAMEALVAAMVPRPRSIGWVVAPTYDLADKIFREIVVVVAQHLRHRIVTLKDHEKKLVLRNMAGGLSEIRGKSTDNPVSLLGEGLDWVIVDEAARMKPAIWEGYLTQRLIDRKGWALLISTPKGKGWFYDLFRRGQGQDPDYQSWNSPSWENPFLDREQIEAERERLPERVFRQEFGGEFLEGSGQVFRFVREVAKGEFKDPVPNESYYGGLDLAKVEDFTVLVIMNGKCEVVFVDRFHRLDWEIQLARVKAATDRYRPFLHVDSTGAGEPILESLRRGGVSAQPYPFSQRSKAALVDNLAIAFERKRIVLPRPELCPELIDELEAFEYSVSESGNVKTGAPGGYHDDCVIALGLGAWIPAKRSPEPTNSLAAREAWLKIVGRHVPRRKDLRPGW